MSLILPTFFFGQPLSDPADWSRDRGVWALCWRQLATLEYDQAAHIVGQVLHPDLHAGVRIPR